MHPMIMSPGIGSDGQCIALLYHPGWKRGDPRSRWLSAISECSVQLRVLSAILSSHICYVSEFHISQNQITCLKDFHRALRRRGLVIEYFTQYLDPLYPASNVISSSLALNCLSLILCRLYQRLLFLGGLITEERKFLFGGSQAAVAFLESIIVSRSDRSPVLDRWKQI